MSLRRWTDALGPPLFAAAALAALVAPAVAGDDQPRSIRPAAGQVSSPVLALRTCSPEREPGAIDDRRLAAGAWFRLDPVLDSRGSLQGQHLIIGRVGHRSTAEMPLAVESFASGPSSGRVLVGDDDGTRSTLRIVDIDRRCATIVHRGRELVRRAVLDESGDGIIEFRLDRSSRADLGVWSRPLNGSKPHRIIDPLAPNARIGRVFATALSWSTDRRRLVVTSCGESFCLARILDRASGRVTTVNDSRIGEVIGLLGDDLVAYGGCPTLPCNIVVMDQRTGRIRVLARLAGLATVSAADGRDVVVFEDYANHGQLSVIGLDGAAIRTLPLDDGLRLVPGSDRALAALELPAGVIAVAEGSRPTTAIGRVSFINLADGRRLHAVEIVR